MNPNPADIRSESRDLHRPFSQWLDLKDIPYATTSFGQKTSLTAGWPDFTVVYRGRCALIEFKRPGQKLQATQADVHARLTKASVPVITATSVEEAIQFVRAELLSRPTDRTELLPEGERILENL